MWSPTLDKTVPREMSIDIESPPYIFSMNAVKCEWRVIDTCRGGVGFLGAVANEGANAGSTAR